MARRPSSYSTLSLAQKNLLCTKAAAEPSWTLAQLMDWGSQRFQVPVKRSTPQGILKRKRDYNNFPEPHSTRKRHCAPPQRALDDKLLHKIDEYKAWHVTLRFPAL
ncbi:hypothetical protein V7S43_008502 [Phytophthora oleae]|uniref:Uncharacterized protein n=1 Tax=Phytophthora oleae TaxID=2107226 RepID=A0ABD3FKJ6_9STRA